MTLSKLLSDFANFVTSRRVIPMLKGTLAYLLAFVLVFLKGFDNLNPFPISYTSMIIIVIAGLPGKSIGACVQAVSFGLLGVCLGSSLFVILAYLGGAPVAQAFVFALAVYILSLIKAQGQRWFGFSLLAILSCFNGIYTSLTLDGTFHSNYLVEYLKAYLWGAAIVLFVNIFIFPKSSERELRETLVLSLHHIASLVDLLEKAYHLKGTEADKSARETLTQTVGADFAFLTKIIDETSIEVNWSKFSLTDYQLFIDQTRSMQRALITAHTTLLQFEARDIKVFRENFLPSIDDKFSRLRKDINQTLDEIVTELGCEAIKKQFPAGHANSKDIEMQISTPDRLVGVAQNLGEINAQNTSIPTNKAEGLPSSLPIASKPNATTSQVSSGARSLKVDFDSFKNSQHDVLVEILISGGLHGDDDSLRLHDPLPSIHEIYGKDHVRGRASALLTFTGKGASSLRSQEASKDRKTVKISQEISTGEENMSSTGERQSSGSEGGDDGDEDDAEPATASANRSLIRVYSVLFSFDRFLSALQEYHGAVTTPRRSKLHFHIFEALNHPSQKSSRGHDGPSRQERELSIKEALAILEDRPFILPQTSLWKKLAIVKDLLGTRSSVFAAKSAAAASIFATLIFVETTRSFFVSYGLTGGLLTVVVALSPTLGQSLVTFVFQILGAGIGYLWGLAVLEMFRNVGGYYFNPYGIVCMIGLYALPLQYLLYERPLFFVLSFLAMNASGVLIFTEWIYVEHLGISAFDSPSLRTGKALASLSIALAIVLIFQLFVLRSPARQSVREALGHLVYSNLSYNTILQAYVRAVLPADPNHIARLEAVKIVERDLKHRERKLQAEIIALGPLILFARAEPAFGKPFREDLVNRIIHSNQVILDRLREARAAIGVEPFGIYILTHFVSVLSPYRRRASRVTKNAFYLCAASLMSKSPLPHDSPSSGELFNNAMHDALALSAQLARTEEGARAVRQGDFTRYWFYLLSISTMPQQLKTIEEACKGLFGELEDDPKLK